MCGALPCRWNEACTLSELVCSGIPPVQWHIWIPARLPLHITPYLWVLPIIDISPGPKVVLLSSGPRFALPKGSALSHSKADATTHFVPFISIPETVVNGLRPVAPGRLCWCILVAPPDIYVRPSPGDNVFESTPASTIFIARPDPLCLNLLGGCCEAWGYSGQRSPAIVQMWITTIRPPVAISQWVGSHREARRWMHRPSRWLRKEKL